MESLKEPLDVELVRYITVMHVLYWSWTSFMPNAVRDLIFVQLDEEL